MELQGNICTREIFCNLIDERPGGLFPVCRVDCTRGGGRDLTCFQRFAGWFVVGLSLVVVNVIYRLIEKKAVFRLFYRVECVCLPCTSPKYDIKRVIDLQYFCAVRFAISE